jgi:hypothetical protein
MQELKIPENLYVTGFIADVVEAGHTDKNFNFERIAKCRNIVSENFIKIKTYHTSSSYHLKDVVERFMGTYISNGEFIIAMIAEGFTCKIEDKGPSCFFNLSKKSYNEMRAQI